MTTSILRVTNGVRLVRDTDESRSAPEKEIVEVIGYRSMHLTLRVWSLKATGDHPVVAVLMETGMNASDPASFVSVGVFTPVAAAPATTARVFTDLQRYVRWTILSLDDVEIAGFSIEGVLYE